MKVKLNGMKQNYVLVEKEEWKPETL